MSKTLLTQDEYDDFDYKMRQICEVINLNFTSAKKQAIKLADQYNLSYHDLLTIASHVYTIDGTFGDLLHLIVDVKSEESFTKTIKPLGNSGMIRMPKKYVGMEAIVTIKYDDD